MTATTAEDRSRVQLALEGMSCASCATRIERKLNKLDGVEASVNLATERASVSYDPAQAAVDDLIRAVEAAGYRASVQPRETEDETDARILRTRLIVSTTLTAPLVLLATVPPLQFTGWEWLAFALATPVVLWAGWTFHRAAASNARHLAATMDTLVSIGTLAAWGWSVVALLVLDEADTYFEVGAVITTLILLGRYLEARATRRASAAIRALLQLGAKDARVLRDGREIVVPIEELECGDVFVVRPG
jgi:P-type Cu+ transporter